MPERGKAGQKRSNGFDRGPTTDAAVFAGIKERLHRRDGLYARLVFEVGQAVSRGEGVDLEARLREMFHDRVATRAVAHAKAIDDE